MSAALRMLWRRNRLLLIAFALALAVTTAFAIRSAMFWIWWQDPPHSDRPIEGWMTPRYVAMSWHVPREVMEEVVGPRRPAPEGNPPALRDIAAERGIPVERLIVEIEAAIAAHRATAPAAGERRE